MEKIIAVVELREPVALGSEGITLHFLMGMNYDIYKRQLYVEYVTETRIPGEIFNQPGQTLVAQQKSEDKNAVLHNVNCYVFLELVGEYNKSGVIEDVGYKEVPDDKP